MSLPSVNREEYHDLNPNNKLDGSFTNVVTTMSKEGQLAAAATLPSPIKIDLNREYVKEGLASMSDLLPTPVPSKFDIKDHKVQNPYGYGYIPSFNEAQLQDAQSILNQESSIFAIGAVTGVSLIVLGILITSAQNAAN
jgi:hypothetical protein